MSPRPPLSFTGLTMTPRRRDETIAHLQGVDSAARGLEQQVDELSRRTAAAEADVAELGEQNNELLGHENPHQKIRQVAAIRHALTESRRVRFFPHQPERKLIERRITSRLPLFSPLRTPRTLASSLNSRPTAPSPRPRSRVRASLVLGSTRSRRSESRRKSSSGSRRSSSRVWRSAWRWA